MPSSPMMAGDERRRGYHHGNAAEALLHAAADLLESAGAANLSLRAIAERAGLSRQAPYNHFADKEALLAALVLAGFARLAKETEAASAALTGVDALAGAGEAYIAFAQNAPALFRLMFGRELVDKTKFPEAAAAGTRSYAVMESIVTQIAGARHAQDVSLAAWCIVHGYATLCIEAGLEPPAQRALRARQFAHLIAEAD